MKHPPTMMNFETSGAYLPTATNDNPLGLGSNAMMMMQNGTDTNDLASATTNVS